MNKTVFAGALALSLMTGAAAHAAINITVTPWLAPNAFGSPNWAPAAANAVDALYNGQTSGGTPGTPAYFQAQSNVTLQETIVTGFPSWLGQVNPGTVFGPAFANELGNRMTFGLSAIGTDGDMFSISQLSFDAHSNDPGDLLAFGFNAGDYNYVAGNYVGVLYGADGQLGGGDDTFVTSGPNTQLVNAIFGRGSGNSFPAYCPGCTPAQQQQAIFDQTHVPGLSHFTGVYSIAGNSGSGTFNITGVPEPTSWALMILGFAGAGVALRRARPRTASAAG